MSASARLLMAFAIASVAACTSSGPQRVVTRDIVLDRDLLSIAGTFSDLHTVKDVGFFGAEVRVVPTSDQPFFQVVVQFGQCAFERPEDLGGTRCFLPTNLLLSDARTENATKAGTEGALEFTLPEGPYAGTFTGVIKQKELVGVFRFASGRVQPVVLARGPSFWER